MRVHFVHAVGRIRLGARKLPPPPYSVRIATRKNGVAIRTGKFRYYAKTQY